MTAFPLLADTFTKARENYSHSKVWKVVKFFNYSHFWIWNILFCIVSLTAILPEILIDCTLSAFAGEMPFSIYLGILGIFLIPFISIGIGVKNFTNGAFLFRYFYSIEVPFMLLFCFRVFTLKQNMLDANIFLGLCATTVLYFAYLLFKKKDSTTSKPWEILPQSILVWTACTIGTLGLLFTIPTIASILKEIVNDILLGSLFNNIGDLFFIGFFGLLFSLFAAFTIVVFVVAPIAFLAICYSTWKAWVDAEPKKKVMAYSSMTIAIVLSVCIHQLSRLNHPPDFERFEQQAADGTLANKSEKELGTIKAQLLNAYLNKYRYPINSDSNKFERWFNQITESDAAWLSTPWNATYRYVVSPFIYRGDRNDGIEAERLYKELFDIAIQKEERESIKAAMEAHYERRTTEAGLLDLEDRNVSVIEQSLNIEDHGTWAQVELFETYQNNTYELQESFYYFSLPEHAAVNGLYLGNTPNKSEAFQYRVSPRGAAQAVYKEQKKRRVDPALLEQVGPNQYRLRVFPIPSKERKHRSTKVENPKLYLWMEFQVLKQGNKIPLPTLLEKRNTEFPEEAERGCNLPTSEWSANQWLPKHATGSSNFETIDTFVLDDHELQKTTKEASSQSNTCVIIDGSYSMRKHQEALEKRLEELDYAQIYLAAPGKKTLQKLSNNSQKSLLGHIELSSVLDQYLATAFTETFDTVIILTDEGGYESSSDKKLRRSWKPEDGTINILHLGGKLAPAYTDSVLDAISASHGGIGTQLDELPAFEKDQWVIHPTTDAIPLENQPNAIAAKLLIEQKASEGNVTNAELSALHTIALKHHIVTPYSSMIVLVNQAQHRQLDAAEKQDDKFEREADTGVKEINANSINLSLTNGSIPEPSSFILLLISAVSTLFIRRRNDN